MQVLSSHVAGQVTAQLRPQVSPQVSGWPENWWAMAVPAACPGAVVWNDSTTSDSSCRLILRMSASRC
jgi:hypothetical protein